MVISMGFQQKSTIRVDECWFMLMSRWFHVGHGLLASYGLLKWFWSAQGLKSDQLRQWRNAAGGWIRVAVQRKHAWSHSAIMEPSCLWSSPENSPIVSICFDDQNPPWLGWAPCHGWFPEGDYCCRGVALPKFTRKTMGTHNPRLQC